MPLKKHPPLPPPVKSTPLGASKRSLKRHVVLPPLADGATTISLSSHALSVATPTGPTAASVHSSFCRAGKGSLFSGLRSGSPLSAPKNGLLLLHESASLAKAHGEVVVGQETSPGSSPGVAVVAPFPFTWDWGRLLPPLLNSGVFAAPSVEPCQAGWQR